MPSILYESFGEGMKRQTNLSRDPDQPLELSIVCKTFPNSAGNSFNPCGGFSTPRSPSYLKQWGFWIRASFWILTHPGPRCSDQKIWYFCPICLLAPLAWPQTLDLGLTCPWWTWNRKGTEELTRLSISANLRTSLNENLQEIPLGNCLHQKIQSAIKRTVQIV